MVTLLRKEIPLLITAVCGIIVILDYFVTVPGLGVVSGIALSWTLILAAFALFLGAATVLRLHVTHISKRTKEQWPYSILMVVAFFIFLGIGLAYGISAPLYQWIWASLYYPLIATGAAFLGVYLASGAYRSFRMRTGEGVTLLVFTLIVMVGNAPLGQVLFPQLGPLVTWLNTVPNAAAIRGIVLTTALGAIIMSFLTLLGYEKEYLGK